MVNKFLGQVVFITGAGSGIGRGAAIAFAAEGAKYTIFIQKIEHFD
jgi:NAD(P)-dependent dehydrogenase (short-subunit alcohol dehydrogenase family)